MNEEIAARMLAQRRVMISGPLDGPTVTNAAAQLMYLDGLSAEAVEMIINSEGGPVEEALVLVDTLGLMRAPLMTDVLGRAQGSAAAVVVASPGTRRMSATASLDLTLRASRDLRGTADELGQLTGQIAANRRILATIVAERSGQTVAWVLEQFDRGSPIMPDDAIERGLIDAVR